MAFRPSPNVRGRIRPGQAIVNPIHPDFLSRLDPDFIEYYNQTIGRAKVGSGIGLNQVRSNSAKYRSPTARDYSAAACVEDITITAEDGHLFTARLYRPDPRTSPYGAGPYPIHVNFHGGGFVFGDLTSDAQICMKIRTQLGIIVADIDYRLRPENAVGKGLEDCWSAVQWMYHHGATIRGNTDSISIGGISAGGQIGAVVQQLARDAGIPLRLAFLGVPCVVSHNHYTRASDSEFPSFVENEFAPCLNWERIKFFRETSSSQSVDPNDGVGDGPDERGGSGHAVLPDFWINPLNGDLAGLCETFIATAGADPLRDEGELYGHKLVAAGVKTTVRRYEGVPHPFMHMPIRKAQIYMHDLCEALRSAHAPTPPAGSGSSRGGALLRGVGGVQGAQGQGPQASSAGARSAGARRQMFQTIKQRRAINLALQNNIRNGAYIGGAMVWEPGTLGWTRQGRGAQTAQGAQGPYGRWR
ncbi:Alpha/Beta hydrolase protein [Xylariales sp. PMI_506]|nr:Alpha/Beta hydrolase protein [Xylariales sp. PMI_506]